MAAGGLTPKQANDFVSWLLRGPIAYQREERSALRGAGMDEPGYYNTLEASALQRARSAFIAIANEPQRNDSHE